jgi:hypothetical protein
MFAADTMMQALMQSASYSSSDTGRRTLTKSELIGIRNILLCPHKHKDRRGRRKQRPQGTTAASAAAATKPDDKNGEGLSILRGVTFLLSSSM